LVYILRDIRIKQEQPTVLSSNNQSFISIAQNLVFDACTKHIYIQYHFVHEMIMLQEVKIIYLPTTKNYVDIFAKKLCRDKLDYLLPKLDIEP